MDELFEVLQPTASRGIYSCIVGVPILLEELEAAGILEDEPLDARQNALKEIFTKNRAYWAPFLDGLCALAQDFSRPT